MNEKAKIRRIDGTWVCYLVRHWSLYVGYGHTPFEAYADAWVRNDIRAGLLSSVHDVRL